MRSALADSSTMQTTTANHPIFHRKPPSFNDNHHRLRVLLHWQHLQHHISFHHRHLQPSSPQYSCITIHHRHCVAVCCRVRLGSVCLVVRDRIGLHFAHLNCSILLTLHFVHVFVLLLILQGHRLPHKIRCRTYHLQPLLPENSCSTYSSSPSTTIIVGMF